jgi:hypothetical protein
LLSTAITTKPTASTTTEGPVMLLAFILWHVWLCNNISHAGPVWQSELYLHRWVTFQLDRFPLTMVSSIYPGLCDITIETLQGSQISSSVCNIALRWWGVEPCCRGWVDPC